MSLGEKYSQLHNDFLQSAYVKMTSDCIDQKNNQLNESLHNHAVRNGYFSINFVDALYRDQKELSQSILKFWEDNGFSAEFKDETSHIHVLVKVK